ncbi:hypothetical protein Y1Q_0019712 [Alligator mississippiensis]|uniref:Uncharacterized protein n=1 Tax=Alligator mississippiensis TaxID=8496 RepID=A0A151PFP8_ALLMI|nr:hypothetical protein Y1Q_0019712 [Alligator mississippiensis]
MALYVERFMNNVCPQWLGGHGCVGGSGTIVAGAQQRLLFPLIYLLKLFHNPLNPIVFWNFFNLSSERF